MIQIMSYDSWSSGITRPIVFEYGGLSPLFFISYVFIASVIMSNVVLAILLDKFLAAAKEFERDEHACLLDEGPAHLRDILEKIDTSMDVDGEHVAAFRDAVLERLLVLQKFVQ